MFKEYLRFVTYLVWTPVVIIGVSEREKTPYIKYRPTYLGPGLVITLTTPTVAFLEANFSQIGIIIP